MESLYGSSISETPILLIGFNRANLLQKRLNEINEFNLRTLFVTIDGGSTEKQICEIKLVLESCLVNSDINYNLIIHKENLGLAKHTTSAISKVLQEFNHVIIVEDDIVLGTNFYNSMLHGLKIADSDPQIATVGGFSPFFQSTFFSRRNYWRKSDYFSAWGWGISRTNWNHYVLELANDVIESDLSGSKTWNGLSLHKKNFWLSKFSKTTIKPIKTWDYQMQFMSFMYDKKHLLPVYRVCDNEGFNDDRGANNVSQRPRWLFNLNANGVLPDSKLIPSVLQSFFLYIDSLIWARDSKVNNIFIHLKRFRIL